jgi:class 3 adenylate cyclase
MSERSEALVRKTVTVLFCDVTGFTNLGERVDPETMRRVMLRYFDEMRTVLERHGGTVEKFIGDAVMAVFGIPVLHEDDALRAVRAADEMRARLSQLNDELDRRWGVRLEERIGINTGEVVAGDASTGQTIATGDAVNVAARLQQAAEPGEILLGRETHALVADAVRAGPLEAFPLRGKSEAVRTWRLDEVRVGAEGVFRRLGSPIVGREHERDLLHDLYRQTLDEQSCALVTVLGPAGIGKTRLAQEVGARLFGATVAHGRCLPYGDGITFFPVVEIVRAITGIEVDDAPAQIRAKLTALLPASDEASLVADRVAEMLDLGGEARSEESFWALRRLFEATARARPLVLVLEDVHWAEPTLLDLVEYLVGWSRGAPILMLCLARPELLERRPSWPGAQIALEPLPGDEVSSLLANLLGSATLEPEVERRIAAAAEGNPLFVEELVRMLVDDGALVLEEGRWHAAQPLDALAIPPSINALLAARLDRLHPEEQAVLQSAAVIGKQFWWSAVAELAPASLDDRVGAHLHALVRKGLVFPAETTPFAGEDSFRFGHILARDAAYATLPKARRADLHERFAGWLEARGGLDEIRGHHLEQAYLARAELGPIDEEMRALGERAGFLLGAAGGRAFLREDMPAAARLLDRAVRLMEDGPEQREAMRELSAALWVLGQTDRADAVLDDLLRAARDDERMEWYARLERAGRGGDPIELERVAKSAVTAFERLGDELGLARAWRRVASASARRSAFGRAVHAAERAVAHAVRAGDRQEQARSADVLCSALLYGPVEAERAVRRCRQLLEDARGNLLLEANVLSALAGLEAMRGDVIGARSSYRRARSIYEELGLGLLVAGLSAISGAVELLAGEPAAAEQELREGLDLLAGGHPAAARYRRALLALSLFAQDRNAEAAQLAADAGNGAGNNVATEVAWLCVRARLGDDSITHAHAAVALAEQTDSLNLVADAHAALAETLARAGRADEAADEERLALDAYARKGNVLAARALTASLAQV